MNYRKGLRYALHAAKIIGSALTVYFMITKGDAEEHGSVVTDEDVEELDKLEQEELSLN